MLFIVEKGICNVNLFIMKLLFFSCQRSLSHYVCNNYISLYVRIITYVMVGDNSMDCFWKALACPWRKPWNSGEQSSVKLLIVTRWDNLMGNLVPSTIRFLEVASILVWWYQSVIWRCNLVCCRTSFSSDSQP